MVVKMYQQQIRFGGKLTPVVKKIIIINAVVYIMQLLVRLVTNADYLGDFFGVSYLGVFLHGMFWQPFTYMFLHGSILHIALNCFAIWMFGGELEETWGSKFFLKYYLLSGFGAGIFISLLNYVMKTPVPTIGASGAIFGLLLAYGITWPNREVLVYFLFPVKIKYLVIVFGLLEFFGTLESFSGAPGNISHIGHLGGLISGFLILSIKANSMKKRKTKGNIYKADFKKNKSFFEKQKQKKIIEKKKKEQLNKEKAKKIIDQLLNKISLHGMDSLTVSEKKDLEWARKHYYPEKNETIH